MKIIIGSKNQAKIEAVKQVFQPTVYECIAMEVSSGVSEQPFSDQETIKGAVTRATHALAKGQGHIGIGLEGGVHETEHGLFLCNWGALAINQESPIIAGGARILLPSSIAFRLKNGEELGPVMDDFAKRSNLRIHEGAVGVLTNNEITRKDMFADVTRLLFGQYLFHQKKNN